MATISTYVQVETREDNEMIPLSPPSKVALSSAQNPLRSITPGYHETDIQTLIESAPVPSSPEEEREGFSFPGSLEIKRELYRQIAVSYAALTLYFLSGGNLMIGD